MPLSCHFHLLSFFIVVHMMESKCYHQHVMQKSPNMNSGQDKHGKIERSLPNASDSHLNWNIPIWLLCMSTPYLE